MCHSCRLNSLAKKTESMKRVKETRQRTKSRLNNTLKNSSNPPPLNQPHRSPGRYAESSQCDSGELQHRCARCMPQINHHSDHLWTLLANANVVLTNSVLECSLRHEAIRRKMTFGTQVIDATAGQFHVLTNHLPTVLFEKLGRLILPTGFPPSEIQHPVATQTVSQINS